MKKTLGRFLLNFFSVTLFLAVAGLSIFFAYGYRFDTGGFTKTSIIDIPSPRTEAAVYLDGEQQAERLPVQLKDISPGLHDMMVEKDGFRTWSRPVDVREDVVSIVHDVLLVPHDLGPYRNEVAVFNENDEIITGDGYVLAVTPGTNQVRAVVAKRWGLVSDEELSFFQPDFEVLRDYADDRLLLGFPNDLYAVVNLSDRQFELFALPSTVERVEADLNGRRVYFLEGGTLYSADFDDLGEERFLGFDALNYVTVHDEITDYVLTSSGAVIFVSMGMPYVLERDAEETVLLENQSAHQVANIAALDYIEAGDYGLLTLIDDTGSQSLFLLATGKEAQILADAVRGASFVSESGFILFTTPEGKLFFHDAAENERRYVRDMEEGAILRGWFDEAGHFLFWREGSLYVADIFNHNESKLLEGELPEYIYAQGQNLFWMEQRRLMRLSWEEAL